MAKKKRGATKNEVAMAQISAGKTAASQKARNEALKTKLDYKSRKQSRRQNTGRFAAAAGAYTDQKRQEEITKRQIAEQQSNIAQAALAKWNGTINMNPASAEGTGDSSSGESGAISNIIKVVGNA